MTELARAAGLARNTRTWAAQMIAPGSDAGQGTPASFVSRSFTLADVPADATLHISAQGLYRCFVNGIRVGMDVLTPGWTCYDDRIAYQSYAVASLLRPGENRIDIWLADGWFRSQMMWAAAPIYNCWGDRIGAIAEITAGERRLVQTGPDWQSGLLQITKSGIYWGEDQDARIQPVATHGVEVLTFDTALLVPQEATPVREMAALTPVAEWTDAEGRQIYDFGQNVGGYVRFTALGEAGARVLVEHAEVLGPDKAFDNTNYRSARAQSTYVLAGGTAQDCQPVFTFFGYRYARVTVTGRASLSAVQSVPITSVPDQIGHFSCGVPAVNRLVMNTVWSQRGNFIEVPTDCPQRDERLGWTGDAQVFAGTACWLADSERFLQKYLRDVMADQRENGAVSHFAPDPTRLHPQMFNGTWAGSTGWGDVITVMPWQLYLHYGDAGVLRECFPAMVRWVDYLWAISGGPIIRPQSEWGGRGFTFGDWLQPVGDNRKPRPTIADDCAATLYHFISTDLAARIAGLIGETAQAAALAARAQAIRAAFAQEYISPSGRLAHQDQTSFALAVLHDLIPAQHMDRVAADFRRAVEEGGHTIGTGFIGTPALLPALTKLGFDDLAEKVFLNRKVPGWLYQVEQGATTIWERWDAMAPDGTIYDPAMNSFNHYAYGAVCQWLFEQVAGVRPDADHPGFARIIVDPTILPALSPVSASHDSRHGRIEAGWAVDGAQVRYGVTLPAGTSGLLLPHAARTGVALNGAPVTVPPGGLPLPAGAHVITFTRPD